ncbi:MAG: class I SAM-dependent methyltransferase [Gammaproteobacteria bacterium]
MSEQRGYQHGYSAMHPEVTDSRSRLRKARTAQIVIEESLTRPLDGLRVLDVGGSSGVMAEHFAACGCSVVAIDIDEDAIAAARNRASTTHVDYRVGDAMALDFADASFDLVLCCHVYEHVPDATRMMAEIERVLRPGGICYFAGGNRLAWREPHYGLPLLSVVPRVLAHWYLRAAGRGTHYHEKHLGFWGLKRLVRRLEYRDATAAMIDDPVRYGIDYQLVPGSLAHRLARVVIHAFPWACPGYIWMLRKPLTR